MPPPPPPPPSFSFLNIFKKKKVMTLPFYDSQLLLILNVSAKFLAKNLIGSQVIVILSEGHRKIQKKKNVFSKHFAECFKYTLCLSGKYNFFHLKSHFLIVT